MKTGKMNNLWVRVVLHAAAWLIVFSMPFLLRHYPAGEARRLPDEDGFFYLNNLTGLLWVVVFYLNAYVLTPRLLYAKKYLSCLLVFAGTFAAILFIHALLFRELITSRPFLLSHSIIFNLLPFALSVAVSTAYRMIMDKNRYDRLLQQKQEETLKSELSFLRSQVSPHFMFNVLNNILALARLKSDQLEPTIFRLSTLLRYMLYETAEESVSLQKEIDYLNSYIDLQKQRIGGKIKLSVHIPQNGAYHEISPMLLIPFIENAFKHGTGNIRDAQIDISLLVEQGVLTFEVKNRFDASGNAESKDHTSGIGLANVTRRLNLLYPERHSLLITKEDGWFIVSLQINLA